MALLAPMIVSGCVFGTGSAAEVEAGALKETEDGLGVVVLIGDAEFDADAEPVNIAELEAGDKAGAEFEPVSEPKVVVELGLVVSGYETYHKLSPEIVVAWNSGVLLGAVFEAEYMMAPCENIRGAPSEVPFGVQLGATAVEPELLDKPETVKLELFAEGMVGELDASAGQWLGFEDPV